MSRFLRIQDILETVFSPNVLNIVDESAKHAGHAGAAPGGETHYAVEIVSSAFEGKTRVQMQRAVMTALQPEFDSGLHALSIKARAM